MFLVPLPNRIDLIFEVFFVYFTSVIFVIFVGSIKHILLLHNFLCLATDSAKNVYLTDTELSFNVTDSNNSVTIVRFVSLECLSLNTRLLRSA